MSMKLTLLNPFGIMVTADTAQNKISLIEPRFIHSLLLEHKLILFRGYSFLNKQHLRQYARRLGRLLQWEFGDVIEMKVKRQTKNYLFTASNVPFHWDGAFHQEPHYLFFHCIEAPLEHCGGETLFTNTIDIYKNASDRKRVFWKSLAFSYETQKLAHYGGKITVDLIQTHPLTGDTILRFAEPVPENYLNPVKITLQKNYHQQQDKIFEELRKLIHDSQFCLKHRWQKNDYLIADNYALLHGRNAFKTFSPRHLRRIQIIHTNY